MNFFKETIESFIWLLKILKAFLKTKPVLTVLVIFIATLSMVVHIVAFLLPIKVILLVGGEGVPRHFAGLIQPEDKMAWAVGLAAASVLSYLLTLILDALNEHLSSRAAEKVVGAANKMKVFARQDEIAAKYYAKITEIFSLLLFLLVALIVLSITNIMVFVYFSVLASVLYVFTAIALFSGKSSGSVVVSYTPGNALAKWIVDNKKDYISILTSIVFLGCFFIILKPYFYDENPNILLSLIAFVVIRHVTNRTGQVIKHTINISKSKLNINTLVFKHHQKQKKKTNEVIDFNSVFGKGNRETLLATYLGFDSKGNSKIISRWSDVDIGGVRIFNIEIESDRKKKHLQQQIYSNKTRHLYEREQFLFQFVSRKELKAPEIFTDYEVEDYQCQIVDAGIGRKILKKEWDLISHEWAAYFAAIKPSSDLVKAYKQSRQLLQQRITETLIEPVEIAVNTEQDKAAIIQFKAKLEQLQQRIRDMPLYINNSMLNSRNIYWANPECTDILVMTWREWTLEPIGSNLSSEALEDKVLLESYVKHVTDARKGIKKKEIQAEDMVLMAYCQRLEERVLDEKYKSALLMIKKINTLHEKVRSGA